MIIVKKRIVREYHYCAADNVSIFIYNGSFKFSVNKSNISDIQIIESLDMHSFEAKRHYGAVWDYVAFSGNETNLSIYIRFVNMVGELQAKNVSAIVTLPYKTNYSVYKWDGTGYEYPASNYTVKMYNI